MTQRVFIGVDDTDVLGGPFGTGRVAREMAEYLEKLNSGWTFGVIRYQLLVDSRIQYTSHNSAKCIEFISDIPLKELHKRCADFLHPFCPTGSDPGLCTCSEAQVSPALISYGEQTQQELVTKEQAYSLARDSGILLSELGGMGDGIIGALAATGLRGRGNGGRYVQLRGIRNIQGLVAIDTILKETDITAVIDEDGFPVDHRDMIDSRDWIKPNVLGGRPVLRVRLQNSNNGLRTWETIEQKHKKNPHKKETVR